MEVRVELKVKAEDFFDLIINSLLYDIENTTHQKISKDEIQKGFTYKKYLTNKLGKQGASMITITELEYPHMYCASFKTARGINTISYEIVENESCIELIYREDYEALSKIKDINHKIMNFFYNRGNKKKMRDMFLRMEDYILSEK